MKLLIPTQLQKIIGKAEIENNADSIDTLLFQVLLEYPDLRPRLFTEDGNLNKFINIYINENDIRFLNGIKSDIKPDDVVSIVPAIAGG